MANNSCFTTLGWIALPFVIALRVPFALIAFIALKIAQLFQGVAAVAIKLRDVMPKVNYREEWLKDQHERRVRETLDNLRMTSQGE